MKKETLKSNYYWFISPAKRVFLVYGSDFFEARYKAQKTDNFRFELIEYKKFNADLLK